MKTVLAVLVGVAMLSGSDTTLAVGDTAPDFTLVDEQGKPHALSDYRGQKVVVYFYPKDDTPGCIKEACNFRDHFDRFEVENIKVFGISYDSPRSHRKFKEKYGLPFTLLSDTEKKVAKAYGAARALFPRRITYLLDEEGKIVKVYDKVSVTTHGEDVLEFYSSLKATQ
ncbi:MAG: peroxiredoxin [Fidelibacterota bacterium]